MEPEIRYFLFAKSIQVDAAASALSVRGLYDAFYVQEGQWQVQADVLVGVSGLSPGTYAYSMSIHQGDMAVGAFLFPNQMIQSPFEIVNLYLHPAHFSIAGTKPARFDLHAILLDETQEERIVGSVVIPVRPKEGFS